MGKKGYFTKKKGLRHGASPSSSRSDALAQGMLGLWKKAHRAFRPKPSEFVFNMMEGKFERERMIKLLWEGSFDAYLGDLVRSNPEVVEILDEATANQYYSANEDLWQQKNTLKFENVIGNLLRMQNEHLVPLLVVLRSVDAHRTILHQEVWAIETALRLLMSRAWTEKLVNDALKLNPGPRFKVQP